VLENLSFPKFSANFKRKTMIREGSTVQWKWGNGTAKGEVKESYAKEITKTIDGSEITRKGEQGNKALLIKQEDGSTVLKLESEVEKA
tara:strand:- start:303 stop:566 length:264 start_codon:yes stop_codon:yes gene_type:complete